jgi:DNA-binding response OmpR family regulator
MKKILVIEDEQALQKTLTSKLETEGYEVFSALNGEEGLAMAGKEKLDLIILDLILPKKNGFEVLEELKTNKKTQDTPVVVLTNLEDMGDIQKVLDLGATTYLVKANYGLDEISEKIKEILESN